ncbi:hypothetical protein ACFS07_26685 [Undibacterium arcticum]
MTIIAGASFAGPADYVYRTYDNAGQRTFALNAGSTAIEDEARASSASLAFGYGISESWFSNLYFEYEREGGNGTKFEGVEWQNIFQADARPIPGRCRLVYRAGTSAGA